MPATGAGTGPLPWVGVRRYMKGEPVDAFHDGFGRRLDIDPLQREFITFCSYGKGGKYCYKDELDSKNFACDPLTPPPPTNSAAHRASHHGMRP